MRADEEEKEGFVLSDEVRWDFTEEAALDRVPREKVWVNQKTKKRRRRWGGSEERLVQAEESYSGSADTADSGLSREFAELEYEIRGTKDFMGTGEVAKP